MRTEPFLLAAILLASGWPALACYCDQSVFEDSDKTVRSAAQSAAVVVRGEVTGVRPTPDPKSGNAIATLKIEESWRGPKDGQVEISTVDNDCRFNFNMGDDYLVYAFKDGEGAFT